MATTNNNGNRQQAETHRLRFEDPNLQHGFAQLARPVLKAKGLSANAKLVYTLLYDYAWDQHMRSCFPGQERLAKDLHVSVKTIRRALNELRKFELITWKRRGVMRTNVYIIKRIAENPRLDFETEEDDPTEPSLNSDGTDLSHHDRSDLSHHEGTQVSHKEYEEEKYEDEDNSNRRLTPANKNQEAKAPNGKPPTATDSEGYLKAQAISDGLRRGQKIIVAKDEAEQSRARSHSPPDQFSDEQKRGYIKHYLDDLNKIGFNDKAPLPASVARAWNLYEKYQDLVPWMVFQMAMQRAKEKTQKNVQNIKSRDSGPGIQPKRKMGYYFSCFEQELKILAEQIQQPTSASTPP